MANRALKIGDIGEDVRALQLAVCGVLQIAGTFDGMFGPATERAVIDYQARSGLDPDGVVGPATWAALAHDERAAALNAGKPVSDDITVAGWYPRARRLTAHPLRVGDSITACTFVIHTTDMMKNTWDGLLQRWHEEPGEYAAAHWLIGQTPEQGLVQMISALRNGNHAGGSRIVNGARVPYHGNYQLPNGRLVHPNTYALGVEVHNPGYLGRRTSKGWVHKDSGAVIPDADVFVLPDGRGWAKVTDYQMGELNRLYRAVKRFLSPAPAGIAVAPNGTYAANNAAWAVTKSARVAGHATLDPNNKTDPGPELVAWINSLA